MGYCNDRAMNRHIGDIQSWVERRHVDFYMTQFLTGHGCFRENLCKYGHDNEEMRMLSIFSFIAIGLDWNVVREYDRCKSDTRQYSFAYAAIC